MSYDKTSITEKMIEPTTTTKCSTLSFKKPTSYEETKKGESEDSPTSLSKVPRAGTEPPQGKERKGKEIIDNQVFKQLPTFSIS